MLRKLIVVIASFAALLATLHSPASAIANGVVVADDELDELGWIGSLVSSDGAHRCTASFISPTQLLTAAHCLDDGYEFDVLIGIDSSGSPSHRYDVAQTFMHPGYDVQRNASDDYVAVHDVGIVEIVGRHDQWIGMQVDASWIAEGTPVEAYGYGMPVPGQLSRLEETIAVGFGCAAGPNPRTHLFCLDNGLVETRSGLVNDTVCAGDSGGPVVVEGAVVAVHSLRMPVYDGCPGRATRSGHTALGPSRDFIEFHLDRRPFHEGPSEDSSAGQDADPVAEPDAADEPTMVITDVALVEERQGSTCTRTAVAEYLAHQSFVGDELADVAISSTGSGSLGAVVAWPHSGGIWQGTISRQLPDCDAPWNLHASLTVELVDGTTIVATASVGDLPCDPALDAVDPGIATDLIDPTTGPGAKSSALDGQMQGVGLISDDGTGADDSADSPHRC